MASKKTDVSSSSSGPYDRAAGSGSAWWRVSGWKLRNKIALALAFPMIAASWFAVDKSVEAWNDQQGHKATAGQIRVLGPTIDYLYAAENATVVARSEKASNSPARTAAVEAVRTAAEELQGLTDDPALTDNQQAQLAGLVALSDQLRDGRAYVTLLQSLSQVRQLHNGVSDFYQSIINGQTAPEPVLQQVSFVMEGRLAFTMQQLQVAYSGNRITNTSEVFSALGVEDAAIAQLARARNDAPTVLDLRSLNASRFDTVEKGEGELAYEETLALYDDLTATVLDESGEALDANAAAARSKALANIVILAASLLTTLVLAWMIARLMTRPVQVVRSGARDVAGTKLPQAVQLIRAGGDPGAIEPIGVHTNEEMGQLARAVDELHQTAVDLAQGEAQLRSQVGEMFVTLSRRNTSLINQQLGLIEDLERDEQDPRRLESLFRLDHLAARMRRTAESLVILSDAPVRPRGDSHSLSLSDALQAATAGVQEYQRVEMRGGTSGEIVGGAAADVVHLLTELVDNALSFSPPTEPVHVSMSSSGAKVVVQISDGGLGLPDDVLTQLNAMLGSDVGITPDAARRMGLFVVSRLAHRHAIDVALAKNSRGGVTATVGLPAALLIGGAPAAPARTIEEPAAAPSAPVVPTVPTQAESPEPTAAPTAPPTPPTPPTPVVPAQETSGVETPQKPLPTRRPDPLSDPLTDPIPGPAPTPVAKAADAPAPVKETVEEPVVPAAETVAPEVAPTPNGVTPLPKRRPGATVPGRQQAVTGGGGSLFDSAAATPAPTPVEEEAPAAPVTVESVEPVDADEPVSMFARSVTDDTAPAASETVDRKGEGRTEGALGIFSLRDARNSAARAGSTNGAAAIPPVDEMPAGPQSVDGPTISVEDPLGLDLPRTSDAPVEPVIAPATHEEPETAELVVPDPGAAEPAPAPEPAPAAPEPVALPTRTPGANGIVPPPTAAPAAGWLGNGQSSFTETSADAGWKAAHRATESGGSATTNAGLPQRQPGRRLVPGSVAPTRTAPQRDPEAIRKRLAAHAAGVSRGRSATVTTANTDKEGPA